MINKKAQIWVETVIYTLIGLSILGLVLGLAKPKIEQMQDKAIIEQSIEMLNNIDRTMENINYGGAGNTRPIDLKIQKGEMEINSQEDYLKYKMAGTKYKYSEVGKAIQIGNIKALTEKGKENYDVTLILDYAGRFDITWSLKNEKKIFQQAPTPYKLIVTNKGYENNLVNIDFS